jgi:hypothetical protein
MTLKSTNPLTHSSEEIQYLRKGIFQFFHFKGFPTLELISRRPNLLHTYTVLCINWFWSFRWSYSRNKSFAYLARKFGVGWRQNSFEPSLWLNYGEAFCIRCAKLTYGYSMHQLFVMNKWCGSFLWSSTREKIQ